MQVLLAVVTGRVSVLGIEGRVFPKHAFFGVRSSPVIGMNLYVRYVQMSYPTLPISLNVAKMSAKMPVRVI